jgi:hypothetical protein
MQTSKIDDSRVCAIYHSVLQLPSFFSWTQGASGDCFQGYGSACPLDRERYIPCLKSCLVLIANSYLPFLGLAEGVSRCKLACERKSNAKTGWNYTIGSIVRRSISSFRLLLCARENIYPSLILSTTAPNPPGRSTPATNSPSSAAPPHFQPPSS